MGWKFPEALGKMSTRNKRQRQLMEMHTAMQGRCSGGRMDMLTFVLPALVRSVCRPLQQKGSDGAEAAIAVLDEYVDDYDGVSSVNVQRLMQVPSRQGRLRGHDRFRHRQ